MHSFTLTLEGEGPAKIRNPHISVQYICCAVKVKFKCLQLNQFNLRMIYFIFNETAFGSVDIYG